MLLSDFNTYIFKSPKEVADSWNLNMKETQFEDIEPPIVRFLPYIFHSAKNFPLMHRDSIKGVLKHNWASNMRFMNSIKPIVQILNDESINYRILKGGALILLFQDFSIRRMGDIDLLISAKDLNRLKEILYENNFVNSIEKICPHLKYEEIKQDLNFVDAKGVELDIHIAENRFSNGLFELMLRSASNVLKHEECKFLCPSAELLVLHAIYHADLEVNSGDLTQGLIDLKLLLDFVDFKRLVSSSNDLGLNHLLNNYISQLYTLTGNYKYKEMSQLLPSFTKTNRWRKLNYLARHSFSVWKSRKIMVKNAILVFRDFPGYKLKYLFWLSTGKLRPLERFFCDYTSGFLKNNSNSPWIFSSAEAQDIRFSLSREIGRDWCSIRVTSIHLENAEFILFRNGIMINKVGRAGTHDVLLKIPTSHLNSEFSLRLSQNLCKECVNVFNEIKIEILHG